MLATVPLGCARMVVIRGDGRRGLNIGMPGIVSVVFLERRRGGEEEEEEVLDSGGLHNFMHFGLVRVVHYEVMHKYFRHSHWPAS